MSCPLAHCVPQCAPYASEGFAFLSKNPPLKAAPGAQQSCLETRLGWSRTEQLPWAAPNTPAWLHRALAQRDTQPQLPQRWLLVLTAPLQLESRVKSPPAPDGLYVPIS